MWEERLLYSKNQLPTRQQHWNAIPLQNLLTEV